MKKYLFFFVLLVVLISCAEKPMKSKQKNSGLAFQLDPKSKLLLFGPSPFKESASFFWKTWPGQCVFHCENKNVLVIEMRTINTKQQLITGTSVFIRKTDNFWYQSVTIPKVEIDSLGGIVDLVGLSDKIKVTYNTKEIRFYTRLDVK
jgi:hypothetical protein